MPVLAHGADEIGYGLVSSSRVGKDQPGIRGTIRHRHRGI